MAKNRTWVFALPVNQEIWIWDASKEDYIPRIITKAQAELAISETRRAIAHWASLTPSGGTPYTPPVLAEHVRKGQRFGSILDAKLSGTGDRRGVYLLIDWLDATFADIESYKSQHVSIGITPNYRDGSGEVFASLIDELSLTEHPRLRGIGSIQDTLSLRLSDAILTTQGDDMSEEEILALFEQYLAKLNNVEELVNVLKADLDAFKAEETPASEDAAQDAPEDAVEASDAASEEEDKKEEELQAQLADKIATRVLKQLTTMRLGDLPTSPAPSGKRVPQTVEGKLAAAKASGLVGIAAINAALK